jgi:hypothetical protein
MGWDGMFYMLCAVVNGTNELFWYDERGVCCERTARMAWVFERKNENTLLNGSPCYNALSSSSFV